MDTKTLFIVVPLINTFLAFAMLSVYIARKTYAGFRDWIISYFLLGFGLGLYSLRQLTPEIIYAVLGNLVTLSAAVFMLRGLKKFHGLNDLTVKLLAWLPLGIQTAGSVFFTYVVYSASLRVALFSFTSAWLCFLIAAIPLLRKDLGAILGQRIISLSYGTMGMYALVRGGFAFADPASIHARSGPLMQTYLLFLALLSIFTAISCLLLVYERALSELKMEREMLEQRVQERTADLETIHQKLIHAEKLNAVGKMVAVVAHEVNSPVCGIDLTLKDLRGHENLSEEEKNLIDLGIGECARLSKLIKNLNQSTKKPTGEFLPFEINDLIDSVILLHRRALKKRGIEVLNLSTDKGVMVLGNADQIYQVLLNLVQNAADAFDGGSTGTISINAFEEGNSVVVKITDDGQGMDPLLKKKIFEPFYTTKPADQGTGLGLTISMEIVKNHGGEMTVETSQGKGTEVTFSVLKNPSAKEVN